MAAHVLDLKDVAGFQGILSKAIRQGALNGLYSAAVRMVGEIVTVTIPQTVPEPSQRGVYKAGWKARQDADGATYENPVKYASIIEFGVRAANVKVGRKMIDALTEWVQIKGFASGAQAKQMAWAIAHSMAASIKTTKGVGGVGGMGGVAPGGGKGIFKGTGLRIMERANKQLPQFIKEEVAREVERALSE